MEARRQVLEQKTGGLAARRYVLRQAWSHRQPRSGCTQRTAWAPNLQSRRSHITQPTRPGQRQFLTVDWRRSPGPPLGRVRLGGGISHGLVAVHTGVCAADGDPFRRGLGHAARGLAGLVDQDAKVGALDGEALPLGLVLQLQLHLAQLVHGTLDGFPRGQRARRLGRPIVLLRGALCRSPAAPPWPVGPGRRRLEPGLLALGRHCEQGDGKTGRQRRSGRAGIRATQARKQAREEHARAGWRRLLAKATSRGATSRLGREGTMAGVFYPQRRADDGCWYVIGAKPGGQGCNP